MKSLSPKRVIVTSLALALMLGGSVLYANRQPALADPADNAALLQPAPQDKQEKKQVKEGRGKEAKGHFNKHMPIIDEASVILGIDKDTLKTALKEKTLVDIAKEKGISEADLIAKLKAARNQKIDEAVQAGKLAADKAEKIKAGMEKHLKFMVNHKDLDFSHKHGKNHKSMMPAPDKLSALLGITEDELHTQLKEGKSLTEIAQAKGISKDQLIEKIKNEMTPWIEKMADHKKESASNKQKSK
ncbi:hypothetical protein [Paenibacillus radicis (ex Xue et al. 2023)]|uniref:LysM domain-containing protein n=1 Tax=Paenibacillus radicis (ex Xue et al. 2023) TaxID=2972489 RepID=A0ABT1YK30_9BACL|nr:hypothetical protein [Paenibacillus radicis (ex Xue et al. 2023)]MCR8633550.1 hypothetical protein [Paenibacillus radicis (ex Xue et al. 2023)]